VELGAIRLHPSHEKVKMPQGQLHLGVPFALLEGHSQMFGHLCQGLQAFGHQLQTMIHPEDSCELEGLLSGYGLRLSSRIVRA